MDLIIRSLKATEWKSAMQMVWEIFNQYEAPEYTAEGIQSFRDFIEDPKLEKLFLSGQYYTFGAFSGEKLIGIVGIRNENHVSLLFVKSEYHCQGVGRALLKYAFDYIHDFGIHTFTVNAAPYAVEFYHKIGFKDLNKEVTTDGIRFTPMKIDLKLLPN